MSDSPGIMNQESRFPCSILVYSLVKVFDIVKIVNVRISYVGTLATGWLASYLVDIATMYLPLHIYIYLLPGNSGNLTSTHNENLFAAQSDHEYLVTIRACMHHQASCLVISFLAVFVRAKVSFVGIIISTKVICMPLARAK